MRYPAIYHEALGVVDGLVAQCFYGCRPEKSLKSYDQYMNNQSSIAVYRIPQNRLKLTKTEIDHLAAVVHDFNTHMPEDHEIVVQLRDDGVYLMIGVYDMVSRPKFVAEVHMDGDGHWTT